MFRYPSLAPTALMNHYRFFLCLTAFLAFNKLRESFDRCQYSYEPQYFSIGPVSDTAISGSSVWRGGFMRDAGLPITLIVVGSAWLLWYYRLFPDIDWIIAAGLVLGGIAILFLDGITQELDPRWADSHRQRYRLGAP